MGTYKIITEAEVKRLGVTPIPTMNILNVKPDSQGNPLRAKSRTVVPGTGLGVLLIPKLIIR